MKSRHWIAAAIGAAALVGTPAMAQTQTDERAIYLGGGLGLNDDEESAWRLFGGYRASRNFAAELGYIDLGEMNIGGTSANASAWELVGLGIVPLTGQISGYGKLGFYRGQAKGGGLTERRTDLTFGLGAQYEVSRNVGVRLEWQRYTDFGGGSFGGVVDQDVLSLNAIYRFR